MEDVEGFVHNPAEKRIKRYKKAVGAWLHDLSTFIRKDVAENVWFCVSNILLESILEWLKQDQGNKENVDAMVVWRDFLQPTMHDVVSSMGLAAGVAGSLRCKRSRL